MFWKVLASLTAYIIAVLLLPSLRARKTNVTDTSDGRDGLALPRPSAASLTLVVVWDSLVYLKTACDDKLSVISRRDLMLLT
jgi:hypothetical protein